MVEQGPADQVDGKEEKYKQWHGMSGFYSALIRPHPEY